MGRKLSITILLWGLLMMFGTICLTGCSSDDEMKEEATPYVMKHDFQLVTLVKIGKAPYDPHYEGFQAYEYRTSRGTIMVALPAIFVEPTDDAVIDEILKRFSDQLSFDTKIGDGTLLKCNAKNSDEVLAIATEICKYEEVKNCEVNSYAHAELCVKSFN